MSVVITDKKLLDSNNYKNLTINQYDKEYYKVNVSGKLIKCLLSSTTTPKLTKSIELLDNEAKIKEILDYFMRNNSINKVSEGTIKVYNKRYPQFYNDDRRLALNLSKEYKDICNRLIKKYKEDRVRFIYKNMNKVSRVIIINSSYESSYQVVDIDEEKCLVIRLFRNKDKLLKMDEAFLDIFLNDIIDSSLDIHYRDYLKPKIPNTNILKTDKVILEYYYMFDDVIREKVIKHNKERCNSDYKQLVLKMKER